jgi:t-SNARE complex subunit (syntaxin)
MHANLFYIVLIFFIECPYYHIKSLNNIVPKLKLIQTNKINHLINILIKIKYNGSIRSLYTPTTTKKIYIYILIIIIVVVAVVVVVVVDSLAKLRET